MAAEETTVDLKRKADDNPAADGEGEGEEDEWVGPMPCEASQTKKRKGVWVEWMVGLYGRRPALFHNTRLLLTLTTLENGH